MLTSKSPLENWIDLPIGITYIQKLQEDIETNADSIFIVLTAMHLENLDSSPVLLSVLYMCKSHN